MVTWQDVRDLERDWRELEEDYFVEDETAQEARDRMSPAEAEADDEWLRQQSEMRARSDRGGAALGWRKWTKANKQAARKRRAFS